MEMLREIYIEQPFIQHTDSTNNIFLTLLYRVRIHLVVSRRTNPSYFSMHFKVNWRHQYTSP